MLLSPAKVVELCAAPANATAIARGKKLERRHRLHIEGPPELLEEFITDHGQAATPEERKTLMQVGEAATVPKFGAYTEMLGKVFTARGGSQYFEFTDPKLQQDFEEYLAAKQVQQRLQRKFQKVSFTGFQGVFLVDLPTEPNGPDELPEPDFKYISSALVHDALIVDDTYEYVIFKQTGKDAQGQEFTYYVGFDDQFAHFVMPSAGGKLVHSAERTVEHGLGYVPAFPPSLFTPGTDTDVTRTSILHKTLPVAKTYLLDHLMHQLDKSYHGFRKFYSYGVPCTHRTQVEHKPTCGGEAYWVTVSCDGSGDLLYPDGTSRKCSNCNGQGKVIPVGPDKTYILDVPMSKDSPDLRKPAGFIEPDTETSVEQRAELVVQERQMEQAALGKEGVLNRDKRVETATGKNIDLQPVFDRCTTYGRSWKHVLQGVVDTMARLRYQGGFRQSAINVGKKYQIETLDELKDRYEKGKKAGLPDSVLFGLLEDIVYTEYADDPMELEYNRIKLYLEPVPTRSTSEVQLWLKDSPEDAQLQELFRRKRSLNDYVARFERENGPLVQFGVRRPFAERIATIQTTFTAYDAEALPAAANGGFAVGETVMVRPGMEHMPEHAGLSLTVAQVQGDTYAVKLPDGTVHKWYTSAELMSMSSDPKPAKKPAMVM